MAFVLIYVSSSVSCDYSFPPAIAGEGVVMHLISQVLCSTKLIFYDRQFSWENLSPS